MTKTEYARRRKQLMRMMDKKAVAVLPAAPVRIRNRDAEHAFRQDSDFLYLTGFLEPEAVAVLTPGRKHGEFILFCRERDPEKETWNGRRAGLEGAVEQYGADDAFPIEDLDEILPGLLEDREKVYYTMGAQSDFDQKVIGWVNRIRAQSRAGRHPPREFAALDYLLHDMRLYKGRSEIARMRKAAQHSARAHVRAMRHCQPGLWEYQVEAELLHEFRVNGMVPSYTPIVGGGANGCILHYIENDARLRDGDLLLIDAAGELEGYAADITRTFPVNGRFTSEQRALYEIVLEANRAAIAKVKPGNHWDDPHCAAVRTITKGLKELGLLKGSLPKLIHDEAYKKFYMHRTGHWLGLDVHDVGDYKVDEEWRILEPGMALTIEPGIYIAAHTKGVRNRKWWDIGIRVEDDVVVTKEGCEVLSADAPKDPDEIESLVGSGL
ncbi:Xaa-Pro aminopeptidase [Endothiovibrio diazotrophicus]